MIERGRLFYGVAAIALLASCGGKKEATQPSAAGAERAWTAPHTAWGDPDLQGMWPIDKLNGTPLQRPESFGQRALLNDDEYAQRVARLKGLNARYDDRSRATRWASATGPRWASRIGSRR